MSFAPAIHFLASSIEASPKSSDSLSGCDSKYDGSFARMNSGTLITFNLLPSGQGRAATDRSAVAENSDPSVATKIFHSPRVSEPLLRGRTISTEHGAWRITDWA